MIYFIIIIIDISVPFFLKSFVIKQIRVFHNLTVSLAKGIKIYN